MLGAAVAIVVALAATAARPVRGATTSSAQFQASSYAAQDVLLADVVVLGGGSAGTYGAIALKDAGKKVLVVEKSGRLGGHFETYIDPATGTPVDYGVQVVLNATVVRNFFARFNVPIVDFAPPPVPVVLADFNTGANVSAAATSDFAAYNAQVNQYPYILTGTNFPNPPPADFSLPFGTFVTKYGLQSEAYAIFNSPGCSGLGNILNQPTISVFRCLNAQLEFEASPGGAVVPADHDYSQLFADAQAELGASVLLSSTVLAAARPPGGAKGPVGLVVQTPAGKKLLLAKQILVAYPQLASNMSPLGLDARESAVFPKFTYNAWYTGLVQNTGLAEAHYVNAGATTPYNIPTLPGLYTFIPTAVPGLFNFWYGADAAVPQSTVLAGVSAALAALTGHAQTPQLVAYADHTPYNLHFNPSDIQAGVYTEFAALQGYRETYYTGAVQALASGSLWIITQSVVQQMVAALG